MACRLIGLLVLGCVVFGTSAISPAQITPDTTLGPESSRVQQNGGADQIDGGTNVNPDATGDSGDLTIITERLILRDGAVVSATTFGKGNGGKITIRAAESVELSGVASDIWEDVRAPIPQAASQTASDAAALPSGPIVEAQGWGLNQQGLVVLVTDAQSQRVCGG